MGTKVEPLRVSQLGSVPELPSIHLTDGSTQQNLTPAAKRIDRVPGEQESRKTGKKLDSFSIQAGRPAENSGGDYAKSQTDEWNPGMGPGMGPNAAIAKYGAILSNYELEEICEYPEIWFVGAGARKIAASPDAPHNFGFDDPKGRYRSVKGDHIAYRYEVLRGLGKGSFGDVLRCMDHKSGKMVACKIIRNERRFHKQAKSEIEILDLLRQNDHRNQHNVIHMIEHFVFRGHLCITFELLECDLYNALRRRNFHGFDMRIIEDITRSVVGALRVLRRNRIIHCDLKPENILFQNKETASIKVIDFGSSCFLTGRVHSYIQSRFYRSPEVILGFSYSMPIDMWSLGCILAELYTGEPLFDGRDEKEQLILQMELLGVPPPEVLAVARRRATYFDSNNVPRQLLDHRGKTRRPASRNLSEAIGASDPVFLDFISKCLTWDPEQRMTPREASRHEFVVRNGPKRYSNSTAQRQHSGGTTGPLKLPHRQSNHSIEGGDFLAS